MRKKQPIPFAQKFPNADPLALRLLERLLAFDPKDRPTAEEVFILFSISYVCVCVLKNHSTQIINCFLSLCFFFGVWRIQQQQRLIPLGGVGQFGEQKCIIDVQQYVTSLLENSEGFGIFRHQLILTSRDFQRLRGNHLASLLQKWSLNLKEEESQRKKLES